MKPIKVNEDNPSAVPRNETGNVTLNHAFDNGAKAFDVICAQCGLSRIASVHDAPKSSEHAPTPWRNAGGMVDGYAVISADGSEIVPAIHANNSNARFIVKAVNSHDVLIAMLRSTQATIGALRDDFDDLGIFGDDAERVYNTQESLDSIAAVLALVEGRQ